MKIGLIVLGAGIIMIFGGFIANAIMQEYEENYSSEMVVSFVKHGGVFTGLLGVGASIAGVLLYIINRYQVAV